MAERQVIKVVKAPPPLTGADNTDVQDQLADIPILKQQLAVALQGIANLKVAMDEQFDTLTRTATAVGSHGWLLTICITSQKCSGKTRGC